MYKPEICPEITEGDDDIEIGACAEILNITKIDTRDKKVKKKEFSFFRENFIILFRVV